MKLENKKLSEFEKDKQDDSNDFLVCWDCHEFRDEGVCPICKSIVLEKNSNPGASVA